MPYPLTGKALQLRQEVYRILEALSKPETDNWYRATLLVHTENLLEKVPEQEAPVQPLENAEQLAHKLIFTVIYSELKNTELDEAYSEYLHRIRNSVVDFMYTNGIITQLI